MFSHASSEGAGVVSLLNVSLDVDVNQEIVPIVTILRSQLTAVAGSAHWVPKGKAVREDNTYLGEQENTVRAREQRHNLCARRH